VGKRGPPKIENLKMIKTAGNSNFIYANGCQSGRRRAPFRKKDLHFRMQRHLKVNYIINLFLSIAIFLNFVLYFTERVADSITFLKKDFRNNIRNELKNTLKYNYKCVLIASIFINSNRLLGGNNPNCQRAANLKNRAFRISRNIIIAG
jgi:hypothetical protein